MKKAIAVLMAVITIFMLTACSNSEGNTEGSNNVIIVVEGYGEIAVTLTPEHAPITVSNFKKLINEGAYDGTIFHRVINNFMIQGGDTTRTSYGKADTIKGEFSKNGVNNTLSHKRGVISMARANDMNSANSQFFICHKNSTYLDGSYAAFGYVTSGMDIVDMIAGVPTNSWNDQPFEDIVITTIKFAE